MRDLLLIIFGFVNKILLVFKLRIIKVNHRFNRHGNAVPDYVRFATLQLLAHEINENGVEGSAAELGVYRGDFAKHINAALPDRTLFLFDTFEGFDKRDLTHDIKNKFSDDSVNFIDTSVDKVMKQMPFPDKCQIIKGYFPDSLGCISQKDDITYALISIDADLYQPIYEGLCYFYPRLSEGGYIIVHDYHCTKFRGAKEAVQEFARNYSVKYVPVADAEGSIVIVKP